MSYTPINWQTGEIITADKLNKMDKGWDVQFTQLFSETVTTTERQFGNEAELTYSTPITAESITVVFNGNRYTCPVIDIPSESAFGYGGVNSDWIYDFTQYPFAIVSGRNSNTIATQIAGTYTISVESNSIEISSVFNDAVNKCVDADRMPILCVSGVSTYNDMHEAANNMIIMYFVAEFQYFYITQVAVNTIHFVPESEHITATFVDDVFTVTVS